VVLLVSIVHGISTVRYEVVRCCLDFYGRYAYPSDYSRTNQQGEVCLTHENADDGVSSLYDQ
jgi:hypothetical protein